MQLKTFVFLLNILCYQQCKKKDVNKSAITAMEFTIDDQHLNKCTYHNAIPNRFLKMFPGTRKSFSRLNI